jgi:hypothetical protein
MSPPSRKTLKKGAAGYGYEPGDEDFLAVERSPWEASASGIGYNSKFSDDDGYKRGTGAYTDSDSGLVNKLPDERRDDAHERLAALIDDSQPYDKQLPGGAGLTKGKGIGSDPRPRVKTGPRTNARD